MSAASSSPAFLDLAPIARAEGVVPLPGSKSVSIRALLLAALAEGETRLTGLLDSDDTRVMRAALEACGVALVDEGARGLRVRGSARFPVQEADLFVGNSGLSIRTLVAVLAFMQGRYRLSGVPRMHERPIGDLVEALAPLGATIRYEQAPGFPPLRIEPADARLAAPVRVRGNASSQFLTGILQSAPLLARERDLVIEVEGELISKPYIDLSLALMRQFGVAVQCDVTPAGSPRFTVAAGARYRAPGTFAVEGDASSASYFLALGLLAGGPVRVQGMGRNNLQGDVRFAEVMAAMGGTVTQGEDWTEVRSPGLAAGFRPKAINGDFNHIPDAAMTFAVAAVFADGPSVLRNIGSWRVKETDRIAAMAAELTKLGATGGGCGLSARGAAVYLARRDHRHLRRSPHGNELLARRLWRRSGPYQRPRLRGQDLPELLRGVGEALYGGRVSTPIPVIAVDGPSGVGKGMVTRWLSSATGYHRLDSGALYRILALASVEQGIPLEEVDAVAALARDLDIRFVGETEDDEAILVVGNDWTHRVRLEETGALASRIAAAPAVRAALLQRQRDFRIAPGLVADGRDMGTVVFPDAGLKIFMDASAEERAQRREKQLRNKGIAVNFAALCEEIRARDARDRGRQIAPLKPAPDAHVLDTTGLSPVEVLGRVKALLALQR